MHILYIEGEIWDARLVEQIIKKIDPLHSISHMSDGKATIDFLETIIKFKIKPKYDFILLDLDLPTVDGSEVLKYIQNSDLLKSIPVVILSNFPKGIPKPEDLGVLACFDKHYDYSKLKKSIEKIFEMFKKN